MTSLFSFAERSIFFRIYSGLLLVCVAVAFFAYLLIETINQERIQSYRESVATGAFYLTSQSVLAQKTPQERMLWLDNASALFGSRFEVSSIDSMGFKARELKHLEETSGRPPQP